MPDQKIVRKSQHVFFPVNESMMLMLASKLFCQNPNLSKTGEAGEAVSAGPGICDNVTFKERVTYMDRLLPGPTWHRPREGLQRDNK